MGLEAQVEEGGLLGAVALDDDLNAPPAAHGEAALGLVNASVAGLELDDIDGHGHFGHGQVERDGGAGDGLAVFIAEGDAEIAGAEVFGRVGRDGEPDVQAAHLLGCFTLREGGAAAASGDGGAFGGDGDQAFGAGGEAFAAVVHHHAGFAGGGAGLVGPLDEHKGDGPDQHEDEQAEGADQHFLTFHRNLSTQ